MLKFSIEMKRFAYLLIVPSFFFFKGTTVKVDGGGILWNENRKYLIEIFRKEKNK